MKADNIEFNKSETEINSSITEILSQPISDKEIETKLKVIYSCIDNTTLEGSDTIEKIKDICNNSLLHCNLDKGINRVAAVCVYPTFVSKVKEFLKGSDIKVASVAGGFPSGQLPLELKVSEVKYAIDNGADEIDTVISRGLLLEGRYDEVYEELITIREACKGVELKVILETGEIQTPTNIYIASKLAIEAGADFIKTSTGKISVGATETAAYVMLTAIKEAEEKLGKKIGFKAAGGISDKDKALAFLRLTEYFLGKNSVDNNRFRIGASRLTKVLYEQLTA
ncbi:MAG: deoxyribose-phosphate aldolase [Bacteroidales bacterium]|nr:deoxyribose-phosphate aldolase [Bacteroidales bacterium]